MSKTEQMNALYEKVSTDLELQKELMGIMQESKEVGAEETREKLIQFAHDAGFDVDFTEMQQFFKDTLEKKDGQLSDAELEMVAGGFSFSACWATMIYTIVNMIPDIEITVKTRS